MFFYKMAVLLCLTVVFSATYSLVWLMALLASVGPEGHSGDVNQMCGRNGNNKIAKTNDDWVETGTGKSSSVASLNPTFGGSQTL